jgi:GNAT superfamily N-acetyltransferase
MEIRLLKPEEYEEAFCLVRAVFLEFEGSDYSAEGIESFLKTLQDDDFIARLRIFGALDGGTLVGVLATRNSGSHIALFFVVGRYHRRGVGRMLFEKARAEDVSGRMTVNSSPYAREIYHHFGFTDTDTEQCTDGIRYIPMVRVLNRKD